MPKLSYRKDSMETELVVLGQQDYNLTTLPIYACLSKMSSVPLTLQFTQACHC